MNREALAAKVEYEGGIVEAIFGYGLRSKDLPPDAPPDVHAAWRRIEESDLERDLDTIELWLDKD